MSLNASYRRTVCLLAFAFALAHGPAALAQGGAARTPGGEPSHAQAMADARFRAGLKAYDKGDYEAARLEFLQAQAIYPRASLLRNLALSELHTNRPLDALEHLRTFLADPETTPDRRALAERSLNEAYAQTGHLSITAPVGSHIKVDGKDVGASPLKSPVDVRVGLHGVDAAIGETVQHESVQAAAGKLSEVAFVQPVVADSKVVPVLPTTIPVVAAPPPGDVAQPLQRDAYWNGRRTVGVIIAGIGAVGMGTGVGFGVARSSQTSNADTALGKLGTSNLGRCATPSAADAAECSALSTARSNNGNDAHIEEALLIGGGVLVAAGLVITLWPNAPPNVAVAPMTGPHTAGLSWSGSF